jgi:hypothetical protein
MTWLTNILKTLARWKTSPAVWAQAVHALLGYAIVLTVWRIDSAVCIWLVGAIVIAAATMIETVFDPAEEDAPFWPSGLVDLIFYTGGVLAGVAMVRFG